MKVSIERNIKLEEGSPMVAECFWPELLYDCAGMVTAAVRTTRIQFVREDFLSAFILHALGVKY